MPSSSSFQQEGPPSAPALQMLPLQETVDPATDYQLASVEQTCMETGFLTSGLLEAASIRHCLAGDIVHHAQGSDIIIADIFVAIADDQLTAAGDILSATGRFRPSVPSTYYRSRFSDEQFPGFCFRTQVIRTRVTTGEKRVCYKVVMVIPASYWHLDLGIANFDRNTVLIKEPRCRFPNKLHYIDALISCFIERRQDPKLNGTITAYTRYQMNSFLFFVPKDLVKRLPPEDLLFIDLFDKVMLPSASEKVCVEWTKIRNGTTTAEEARKRIPRKDLAFAKFKAEYQARKKAEEMAGKEDKSP